MQLTEITTIPKESPIEGGGTNYEVKETPVLVNLDYCVHIGSSEMQMTKTILLNQQNFRTVTEITKHNGQSVYVSETPEQIAATLGPDIVRVVGNGPHRRGQH